MHPGDHLLMLAMSRELSPRRQSRVEFHLSGCDRCRARAIRLQSALEASRDILCAAVRQDDPSDKSRARLRRALARAAARRPWGAVLQAIAIHGRDAATLAAALMLAVALWTVSDGAHPPSLTRSGVLPIGALTPGSVSPLTAAELCAGVRPVRLVRADVRDQVLREYGMEGVAAETYELDALITPELGGTAAPENLWPQRYASPTWNAHVKDALEQLLAERVCRTEMTLEQAQRDLALDWVAAYKRYFGTDEPIPAHAAATAPDDDLIVETIGSSPPMARLFDAGDAAPPLLRTHRKVITRAIPPHADSTAS